MVIIFYMLHKVVVLATFSKPTATQVKILHVHTQICTLWCEMNGYSQVLYSCQYGRYSQQYFMIFYFVPSPVTIFLDLHLSYSYYQEFIKSLQHITVTIQL